MSETTRGITPGDALHGSTRHRSPSSRPRVVLADRGDALVSHLSSAIRQQVDVVDQIDAELNGTERLVVAGLTFRIRRRLWVERFFKSNLAFALRSRRATATLDAVDTTYDVVLQTHALFKIDDPRTVLYVDCTHRQVMECWPDWNPLRGAGLRRWLDRERSQYFSAAHVFAFSAATESSLVGSYGVPADRVTVVGAGVNFETLPVPAPRRDGPPTLLFVGNDFERKGGPELLAAFEVVRRRFPDARLRLVGTPPRLPAQPGVEVLGRVSDRATMSELYAEATVFCLPAVFDPFPLVLLEAMAHGLPCVVTPTCGVPEMARDEVTALFVEPSAPGPLADAVIRVLEDPDLARSLGDAGRRRVQEDFLWSHVVARMAPVFAQLGGQPVEPLVQQPVQQPSRHQA